MRITAVGVGLSLVEPFAEVRERGSVAAGESAIAHGREALPAPAEIDAVRLARSIPLSLCSIGTSFRGLAEPLLARGFVLKNAKFFEVQSNSLPPIVVRLVVTPNCSLDMLTS